MTYDILWADAKAQKSFEKWTSVVKPRVIKSIKELLNNPRPSGVKKMQGKLQGAWRIRIGDYRLIYDIDDKAKKIILLEFGHRKNIYR
ncbi:hypothetical protein MNBD_UNCLBAC01-1654 [hydrothermal vent metagenome]|uniref:RelE/StbE replicon stabilization toxin n=1 Tax=hydrothermal vent metagenome TaxID=652676 RepID=A0A3B1D467_9ZZZZ